MTETADVLLVGSGDLGTEIGLCLVARGIRVAAMRRRSERVPEPLIGISGDVTTGLPESSDMPNFSGVGRGPRDVVVCLTAGGREEEAYRRIFLHGVGRVVDDLTERGWVPERAVFVSSTGVCASEGMVDEKTPPAPATPTSAVLLEAERQFLAKLPAATNGIIVRPSGIYGPGREWFIDQVRAGQINHPGRMTHRIHRDDAAAAIAHLLTMEQTPDELYLLSDDEPVRAESVAAFIADRLGVSRPDADEHQPMEPEGSRRLSNARLLSTGFTMTYPSYREGYAAILDGVGTRHR